MADAVDIACTGVAAVWCPIHGDCLCPRDEHGRFTESDECPLHAPASDHAARPMDVEAFAAEMMRTGDGIHTCPECARAIMRGGDPELLARLDAAEERAERAEAWARRWRRYAAYARRWCMGIAADAKSARADALEEAASVADQYAMEKLDDVAREPFPYAPTLGVTSAHDIAARIRRRKEG